MWFERELYETAQIIPFTINIQFFFVRMERVNKEARREQNPNEEGLHKNVCFFFSFISIFLFSYFN